MSHRNHDLGARQDSTKTSVMPAVYQGPWPDLMLEALAYHESGHAIMAAHHGMVIINVWIADGRPKDAPEEPAIHGACLCAQKFKFGDDSSMAWLSGVYQTLGPLGSEPLAPRYQEFHNIHVLYPQFFSPEYQHHNTLCKQCGVVHAQEDPNMLVGTVNDMEEAFRRMIPFYKGRGLSPAESWDVFQSEFRAPTMNVMKLYEPVVHALSKELMAKRYLTGDIAHNIICRGNPANMPGCTTGIVGMQLHKHIMQVEREYRDGKISLDESYGQVLGRVGNKGPTGRGMDTDQLLDFLIGLDKTLEKEIKKKEPNAAHAA